MNIVVIGSGLVGSALGPRLGAAGHRVVGTTTTPAKLAALAGTFDEVHLLRGADTDAVAALVATADAVVVTAGPSPTQAMRREDRAATYHDVLVRTAENVVAAGGRAHLVALSSLSVYGRGPDGAEVIDEDTPTTGDPDPSPLAFIAAERVYLGGAGDRSCVFRCADITGPADMSLADKVSWAHRQLGGSVPFSADALFVRVHVDDVVDACVTAVERRLVGVFNLVSCDEARPNGEVFDEVAAGLGLPPLQCRNEIAGPLAPVSGRRLTEAGFTPSRRGLLG